MKRIIVCGGRDYQDAQAVSTALDSAYIEFGNLHIIQGGASGADLLAKQWAVNRNQRVTTVPADWTMHGRSAGPIRNQIMLDRFMPDLVIAFPGGRGTFDMVTRAQKAGVPVREYSEREGKRPTPSPEILAERAPPPPADLVQATQDGPHPAVGAKRVKGMKAVKLKERK
jgi:hypothetical protein